MPALVAKIKPIRRGDINATARHWHRNDVKKWSTAHVDPSRSQYNETLIGSGDVSADLHAEIDGVSMAVAVGTDITGRPPHRSARAGFPHAAPHLGLSLLDIASSVIQFLITE